MPTLVQSKTGEDASSPGTLTFDSSTTSGNTIIVKVGIGEQGCSGAGFDITDNKGNGTFTAAIRTGPGADTTALGEQHYAFNITGGSSHTITFTATGGFSGVFLMCIEEWSGLTTTDPLDKVAENSDQNTSVAGVTTATLSQADELISQLVVTRTVKAITTTGYTEFQVDGAIVAGTLSSGYQIVASTSAVSAAGSWTGSETYSANLATFKATTLAVEQEGYRFRNDDGSESSATWIAAQDTPITAPKATNTRLRILTDTNNVDSPTRRLKLQYRKVGDDGWRDLKQ